MWSKTCESLSEKIASKLVKVEQESFLDIVF